MKRICRASGVRYPGERIALVKEAIKCRQEKARERAKKEKSRCGAEPATYAQETNRQPTSPENLRRSIEIEKDQKRHRKEIAKEVAKEIMLLALDYDKRAISGPVHDALEEVLPRILKRCYGITLSFWEVQKLNEITQGDISYETVTETVQYTRLMDDEKQAIHDLLKKLDGITLVEIARYAKLSDEKKETVRALFGYSLQMRISPFEAIAFLDLQKKLRKRAPWFSWRS